ncbi:MAG: SMC-Scp complex subunit ScpB [Candidatus Acidiferrales bacterium]
MTPQEIQAGLEAIIYAADEPATIDQISKALGIEKPAARAALDQLTATYQTEDRGIEVRKVAGGWKFYTKAQHHDVVRKFIKSLQPPLRLTMPALETLAVIAYKQPVTVPEINEIRGVHVGGVIKTLLEKRLITTAGRKEVIGRPILYRTSKQFMMRFGLSDLDELPSLKEFEALAQAALGSDEGIAEVQPEEAALNESASSESSTAAGEQAPAEDASSSSSDASAEQQAKSERSETPAQSAAEANAESPEMPATEATPDSTEESDKSRAAAAGSSPHQTNEPSA